MGENDRPPRPLAGVQIVDLSRVLAGPWCTQQLADLGADVVKIERPGRGDDTRRWGPPWVEDSDESTYFMAANRGKRSVCVDFSQPEGRDLVRRLVADADVLVENFKLGGLAAYGLDYASLRAINPRLVYCSISGFGQTGPYAQRPGYDFLIQAMGGLMSVTGEPGGEPMKAGVAFADVFTGLYAANAVLAALHERRTTDCGRHIDLALLDVQVAVLANQAAAYLNTDANPPRLGNAHPSIAPYQVFAAADEDLVITVGNDDQFRRLAATLGQPELADDPRFASNAARVTHRETLAAICAQRLATQNRADWLAALAAAGVPSGPINTLDQVFADPQVRFRNLRIDRRHASGRDVPLVANPTRFDDRPTNADLAPPRLGEHTEAILKDRLGLDAATLTKLAARGVIGS